ncbi:MAG TPA: SDR family NAD(P)-dependent oxidoreductase [Spirochaetia bacterium]|nr:SDR family NAD(P)-dependent oxidoreductase [Spirochaetia bacterium]
MATPPRALVTGASRGIGKAIAAALAGAGYEVLGTARDPAALSQAEKIPRVLYLPLELTDEKSISSLVAEAGEIGILINNAGGSQIGPIEEVPLEAIRGLFEKNLIGSVRLTQALLPGMRSRRAGRIIFISSYAGVSPVPFLSVYAATKAALTALARGLRQEVQGDGIRVSVIAPFDIHTAIPLDLRYASDSPYKDALLRVKEVRDRSLAEAPDPSLVARKVLAVLSAERPRAFYPVGRNARLMGFLLKHLPDSFVERAARKLFRIDATRR